MEDSSTNGPFHMGKSPFKKRQRQNKNDDKENVSFLNQDVNLVDSILFPEGYENLMLAIYFLTVPYIAGLLFIFFYISKSDTTIFLSLNDDHSFLITWAIGYEVVAAIILLWIAKLGFSSVRAGARNESKKFTIP